MATILLQAAGAAIGGLLGPVGAAIGAAAGALAGYTIDQALINGTRRVEGRGFPARDHSLRKRARRSRASMARRASAAS